ncbi:MAG TPA: hypothetical protein VGQ53_21855, partial [Chitinophagaceae bacterium]|nr:hypothetical protein [Chitinophagaceae bacterium]
MLDNLKILFHQGKQYIPDVTAAEVPGIFRGRPVISSTRVNDTELAEICPTNAISADPLCIDLGKCTFCGECAFAFPDKIKFTTDYKIATNERNRLLIKEAIDTPIELNPELIKKEISEYFGSSLKLRQVCAGGDNSC